MVTLFCGLTAVGRRMERGSEHAAPLRSILARVELKLELLARMVSQWTRWIRMSCSHSQKCLNGLVGCQKGMSGDCWRRKVRLLSGKASLVSLCLSDRQVKPHASLAFESPASIEVFDLRHSHYYLLLIPHMPIRPRRHSCFLLSSLFLSPLLLPLPDQLVWSVRASPKS